MASPAISPFGTFSSGGESSLIAGSSIELELVYTVGSINLEPGDSIKIDTESDSDWAKPQLNDPESSDYLNVIAPDGIGVSVHTPDHKTAVVTIQHGVTTEGDRFVVKLGNSTNGVDGLRAQTFYEFPHHFYCTVRCPSKGESAKLDPVELEILGGDPDRLVVTAPSDIEIGSPFALVAKAEDKWGNPAHDYRGAVSVSAPGLVVPDGDVLEFGPDDSGVRRVEGVQFTESGATSISASDTENGLSAQSNPIRIHSELPAMKLYWGDPHSGQVADPHKIGDYFKHAVEVSNLDFAGYQRNDSAHSTDAYEIQQVEEKAFHQPGQFVPIPGYEWSGHLENGGHHNVYFGRYDLPMKRWNGAKRLGRPGETDLPHVRDLHDYFRGTDTVITPHVGGQHADLQWHDPTLEPAVEVTSTHGSFEWILRESIERGYEMGFVGGNDCHTGRPGDDRPGHQLRRYSKGGLTGLYTDDLTLKGVLDAMKARRVYATTGARIRASVHADGHFIGEKYSCSSPVKLNVEVEGTGPLERVELYRGLELIHTESLSAPSTGNRVRVLWDGASRMSSYSGIVWSGFLETNVASLGDVSEIRFDSPRSNYVKSSDSRIELNGWACGYPSGVTVELSGDPSTEITLVMNSHLIIGEKFGKHGEVGPRRMALSEADSVRISASLGQLAENPAKVDLGHLNRSVILELAPEPSTDRSSFSFVDQSPEPGVNPYWVKVIQQDMELAWTSPIFADYTEF